MALAAKMAPPNARDGNASNLQRGLRAFHVIWPLHTQCRLFAPYLLQCGRLARVDKYQQLRARVLEGRSDANINFEDLRRLLVWLGFEERIRGSHHIFRKQGVRELIDLQEEGNEAKVYQVRQVRQVIVRYGLEAEEV